ncbi:MAG: hypothetical protein A3E80_02820 [Chlamydiae bacterium RIFCSPHIGHO2_12_FULL_49_9]|nr:MAG: hypothetical protein A3E80_02820 [Chlamydiae bacterium RIFCSPHIGHO2_12_FULL_49_9]
MRPGGIRSNEKKRNSLSYLYSVGTKKRRRAANARAILARFSDAMRTIETDMNALTFLFERAF